MRNVLAALTLAFVFLVAIPITCVEAWTLNIDGKNCGLVRSSYATINEVNITTEGGLKCGGENPPTDPEDPPEPPETPPNTRVVAPGAGLTFLPTCVNGIHWASTNCEYTGSMRHNQYYAILVDNRQGSTQSYLQARVSRSETNDSNVTYEIAVSITPGDFNVAANCKSNTVVNTAYSGAGARNACPVPLSLLYVNVRTVRSNVAGKDITECGRSLTCRPKVFGSLIY